MNKKEKHERRVRRLMARLTLLNSEVPYDKSEYQQKMWLQERAQIIRQLKRHGIEIE